MRLADDLRRDTVGDERGRERPGLGRAAEDEDVRPIDVRRCAHAPRTSLSTASTASATR